MGRLSTHWSFGRTPLGYDHIDGIDATLMETTETGMRAVQTHAPLTRAVWGDIFRERTADGRVRTELLKGDTGSRLVNTVHDGEDPPQRQWFLLRIII
jgi:hypothetical protein